MADYDLDRARIALESLEKEIRRTRGVVSIETAIAMRSRSVASVAGTLSGDTSTDRVGGPDPHDDGAPLGSIEDSALREARLAPRAWRGNPDIPIRNTGRALTVGASGTVPVKGNAPETLPSFTLAPDFGAGVAESTARDLLSGVDPATLASLAARVRRIDSARGSTIATESDLDTAIRGVVRGDFHGRDGAHATAAAFTKAAREHEAACALAMASEHTGALPANRMKVRAGGGSPTIGDRPAQIAPDANAIRVGQARGEACRTLRESFYTMNHATNGAARRAARSKIRSILHTWEGDIEIATVARDLGWRF